MSHANIAIPVTVFYIRPGTLETVSWKDEKNPETEHIVLVDKGQRFGPFNPWQLREDFLSWPLDGWQGFVALSGGFDTFPISKKNFEQWQKLLREALIRPAREWAALESEFRIPHAYERLSLQPRLGFDWGGKTPQALIVAHTPLEAIIATIQIDKLRGAEFRVCARHDCKNPPFRVEARHKIYCSIDCAHLVAVRNSRKRAARRTGRKRK